MIRIGCMSRHPDDALFFQSEAVRQWALQHNRWLIEEYSFPADANSADVLLLQTRDLNKHYAGTSLSARVWILISSKKADAYRAWQLGAAFFLLRPFSLTDLQRALERAEQCLYWNRRVLPPPAHIPLELQLTKGRRLAVHPNDILFLEAQGEVTRVHLAIPGQEKVVATRNLGYWERQLEGPGFLRIHKKFLVNIARISDLNAETVRIGDCTLPLAKRRRKTVEKCVFLHKSQTRETDERSKVADALPVVNKF